MTHIMVDIETLGTGLNAPILQIAAVAFNIETGEYEGLFNEHIDIANENLRIDGDTLKWWIDTDAELLSDIVSAGQTPLDEALFLFGEWVRGFDEPKLWGNGILFDNAILREQMTKHGYEYPIHFRHDRDVRTILELASHKLGISERELRTNYQRNDLKKHDALDDCKFQAGLVVGCYQVLMEGGN